MIKIIASIGTNEVKNRFEECARAGGYHVKEWLLPGHNGKGLRVAATMRIKGRTHGLGFKWNGEDINELAQRCIALDYAMQKLPAMVAQGKVAPWEDN